MGNFSGLKGSDPEGFILLARDLGAKPDQDDRFLNREQVKNITSRSPFRKAFLKRHRLSGRFGGTTYLAKGDHFAKMCIDEGIHRFGFKTWYGKEVVLAVLVAERASKEVSNV